MDKEGLCYRVLVARYGEDDGHLREGGRCGSSWWREVEKVCGGVGGVGGGWFKECISKSVRNGRDTFFGVDLWLGRIPLVVQFRRLYDLCVNKYRSVEEMFALGWAERGATWQWKRHL